MHQLPLFRVHSSAEGARRTCGPLDAASEHLLRIYRAERGAALAHPRSVAREVSQLRSITRESHGARTPVPLAILFADLERVARALREPARPIAQSTGLARLLAAQRFIRIIGPRLGRDPAADLDALDRSLPARRQTGWHAAGTVVAGAKGRRRRRAPTLDTVDLHRLIEAAGGATGAARAARDRALVALHCFSGLRPEEIACVRWEDLGLTNADGEYRRLTAAVVRGGRPLQLPIPGPAAGELRALAGVAGDGVDPLAGPVFVARASGRSLGYRAARDVLRAACRRSGIPPVETADLRAAFAHWLLAQGLSDHEVAAVLGVARVRSVDRLLRRHRALDAQRRVREMLER